MVGYGSRLCKNTDARISDARLYRWQFKQGIEIARRDYFVCLSGTILRGRSADQRFYTAWVVCCPLTIARKATFGVGLTASPEADLVKDRLGWFADLICPEQVNHEERTAEATFWVRGRTAGTYCTGFQSI
jgi:hypothetical protein